MVEDTEAPVVEKVVLKGPKVVQVVFNKDVYKGSLGGYNNRRDTGNVSYEMGRHVEYTIDKNVKKIARNVVQYEFNIELSKRADVTVEGVTNHSGVEMDKVTVRVDEEIDYTEPEIVSAPLWYHEESKTKTYVNDDGKTVPARKAHLLIEFDKDIKGNFDKPEDYFALYEREVIKRANIDDEVDIEVSYARNYDRLLVSIDGLKINNKDKDFDYVLEIRDFKDNSGNRMYRDYVEFELKTGYDFQVDQSRGVKGVEIDSLYSDGTGREITLYFTEAVDLNLATDKTNYIFRDGDDAEDLVDLGGEAIVERDGKTVTLRIPSPFKETNYDTLELSIALKDKEGVRISGPRVYTFATRTWKDLDVKPVEKETNITYINAGKPVEKDELVLDVATDMNTISVKITGKENDTAQVVVYDKNGLVVNGLLDTITIGAGKTEETKAIKSQTLAKDDVYTIVTKMGKEEAKLVVKAIDTDLAATIVYNADNTIKDDNVTGDINLVLPYGTDVNVLSKDAFTIKGKTTATVKEVTKSVNKLFITVAAENGEQDVYTVTLTEATIDSDSTVTASKATPAANEEVTITVVLKDTANKAVKGIADKFVVTHNSIEDPQTVVVGEVTETAVPGTYTFTVKDSKASHAVVYTVTVDGVGLTPVTVTVAP